MELELHKVAEVVMGSNYTMGLEIHHGVRNAIGGA